MTKKSHHAFSSALLDWYDQNGRKNLPWQGGNDPYPIWLSEIMLQQTQVATVIPYYKRFIDRFPALEVLANASQDDVLAHWSGLGYYARARNLHRAAGEIMANHNGHFPQDLEGMISLPGIGRSTAAAILNFAFDQSHPILDGNVKRVLTRLQRIKGWPGHKKIESRLWQHASDYMPQSRVSDYTQAIMDLGATVCTRSKPDCGRCPVHSQCQAHDHGDITNYPMSAPGRVRPSRQTRMLIIENEMGQVQLEKRAPSGIWGGLYCLPECAVKAPLGKYLLSEFGLTLIKKRALPKFLHRFSHFDLEINPIHVTARQSEPDRVKESSDYHWFDLGTALGLGLPKPTSNLLTNLELATGEYIANKQKI